jgi:hypothetical protein
MKDNKILERVDNYVAFGDTVSKLLFESFMESANANTPQCCHIMAVHLENVWIRERKKKEGGREGEKGGECTWRRFRWEKGNKEEGGEDERQRLDLFLEIVQNFSRDGRERKGELRQEKGQRRGCRKVVTDVHF